MKIFKLCDLLGEKLHFKIDSKSTFKTILGGNMTIITVISIIILTWFIGQDIVYHENPFSFQQQSMSVYTPNITLDANSFPISISVYSIDSEILYDPTFFSVELIYQNWKIENDIYVNEDINIKMELCTLKHFPMLSNETFSSLALDKVLCPNYKSVNIFGSWSEPQMNRLKVQLKMCDWQKEKNFCKNEEDIKKYFNKYTPGLNILYLDVQVNVNVLKFKISILI